MGGSAILLCEGTAFGFFFSFLLFCEITENAALLISEPEAALVDPRILV